MIPLHSHPGFYPARYDYLILVLVDLLYTGPYYITSYTHLGIEGRSAIDHVCFFRWHTPDSLLWIFTHTELQLRKKSFGKIQHRVTQGDLALFLIPLIVIK